MILQKLEATVLLKNKENNKENITYSLVYKTAIPARKHTKHATDPQIRKKYVFAISLTSNNNFKKAIGVKWEVNLSKGHIDRCSFYL